MNFKVKRSRHGLPWDFSVVTALNPHPAAADILLVFSKGNNTASLRKSKLVSGFYENGMMR